MCAAKARSVRNQLRKNFFKRVSFETIFAFGSDAGPAPGNVEVSFVPCIRYDGEEAQRLFLPEAAQFELAALALEIEAELGIGASKATPAELIGIDRVSAVRNPLTAG